MGDGVALDSCLGLDGRKCALEEADGAGAGKIHGTVGFSAGEHSSFVGTGRSPFGGSGLQHCPGGNGMGELKFHPG